MSTALRGAARRGCPRCPYVFPASRGCRRRLRARKGRCAEWSLSLPRWWCSSASLLSIGMRALGDGSPRRWASHSPGAGECGVAVRDQLPSSLFPGPALHFALATQRAAATALDSTTYLRCASEDPRDLYVACVIFWLAWTTSTTQPHTHTQGERTYLTWPRVRPGDSLRAITGRAYGQRRDQHRDECCAAARSDLRWRAVHPRCLCSSTNARQQRTASSLQPMSTASRSGALPRRPHVNDSTLNVRVLHNHKDEILLRRHLATSTRANTQRSACVREACARRGPWRVCCASWLRQRCGLASGRECA